jgi:hypothetical protein
MMYIPDYIPSDLRAFVIAREISDLTKRRILNHPRWRDNPCNYSHVSYQKHWNRWLAWVVVMLSVCFVCWN